MGIGYIFCEITWPSPIASEPKDDLDIVKEETPNVLLPKGNDISKIETSQDKWRFNNLPSSPYTFSHKTSIDVIKILHGEKCLKTNPSNIETKRFGHEVLALFANSLLLAMWKNIENNFYLQGSTLMWMRRRCFLLQLHYHVGWEFGCNRSNIWSLWFLKLIFHGWPCLSWV